MIVLNLPIPVSVNALFFNAKKGRVRTDKYNAWRTEAGWMLKEQRQKPIPGPVALALEVKDEGRFDLSNMMKSVEDLLVLHGMIEGDGRDVVRKITMEWADIKGCRVTVQSMAGE